MKLDFIKHGAWLIFFATTLFSCKSYKDFTFLIDRIDNEEIESNNTYAFDHTIKVEDNLYVNIVSSNHELNKVYNPSISGGSESASNIRFDNESGQYINGYRVDTNGDVNLPIIGKVKVVDLNLEECEAKIENRAKDFLKEVNVRVRLLNYKITVLGEVERPGVYYNFGGYNFTVIDALATSGGVTEYAEITSVVILRPTETGQQTFNMDLSSKSAISSEGYFLYPNDVVVVDPSKRKNIQLRKPYYNIALPAVSIAVLLISLFY